ACSDGVSINMAMRREGMRRVVFIWTFLWRGAPSCVAGLRLRRWEPQRVWIRLARKRWRGERRESEYQDLKRRLRIPRHLRERWPLNCPRAEWACRLRRTLFYRSDRVRRS